MLKTSPFLRFLLISLGLVCLWIALSIPVSSNSMGIAAFRGASDDSKDQIIPTLNHPHLNAFYAQIDQGNLDADNLITQSLVKRSNRDILKQYLKTQDSIPVNALLKPLVFDGWKELTTANRPSGSPLEIAILSSALLQIEGSLPQTRHLMNAASAQDLNTLEPFYVSLITLVTQFSWEELSHLSRNTERLETYEDLAELINQNPEHKELLLTISQASGSTDNLSAYIFSHPNQAQAWEDLLAMSNESSSSIQAFLDYNKPLYSARAFDSFFKPLREGSMSESMSPWVLKDARAALSIKYGLIFVGFAFLMAGAFQFFSTRSRQSFIHLPYVNFALLTASASLILIFITESSFPANPTTPASFTFELNTETLIQSMNPVNFDTATTLTLLGFFIIQALIYRLCLKKLRHIQSQNMDAEMKIRILENEENLFDLGLYVGLSGTVAALMMLSLGIVSTSLIAAYASTLFGIISVALLKVIHVRPYRETLLIDDRD